MRQLSDIELQEIRKSILLKEISSAEILMEIYDHYISHLQEFSESEFSEQLFELDQKFSYGYCHALQSKFKKEAKKDIHQTQWKVIRTYFCTSRWLFFAGILVIIFTIATQTRSERETQLMILSPLILLTIASFIFNWKNYIKLKPIKKAFKGNGISIQSSLALPISERMYLPVLLIYTLNFSLSRLFELNIPYDQVQAPLATLLTAGLILYFLSLMEVWKIKSKTALV
ncbi:hypothetical protein SAMN04488104_1001139 [Algoriphagus faecimaris]|uniref:Uncharacterized protein n=1 Tax=Algoriphagus faecimaris TaxID=686796 RepID=A0A1G6MFG6_9BACT|nr:hypothetical protein [Algoriphagus faecimaris]SDC53726.1 hypothetical protein SAMN04488104_1001139 [Algoriphagus faecimaris]